MRITAGTYRNRQIKCPKGVIRPAMERMRESLFSILGNIDGLSFLDLFCGSGLVGIEAASRGCSPIHLVEMDRGKRLVIMENLSIVREENRLFMMRVEKYFKICDRQYDIVYLDPPFPMENKQKLIELVDQVQVSKPGGLVIIHYPAGEKWLDEIGMLKGFDHRKYGGSHLFFLKNCRE